LLSAIQPHITLTPKFLFLVSFILLNGLACQFTAVQEKKQSDFVPHERLLQCKKRFYSEDSQEMDAYYHDRQRFFNKVTTSEQRGDTLVVQTIQAVNGCGDTKGDIRIQGDTMWLLTKEMAKELCASISFEWFAYHIYNPERIKFKFVSED
jgi:hypothetical protein